MDPSRPARNKRPPAYLLDYDPTFHTTSSEENPIDQSGQPVPENRESTTFRDTEANLRSAMETLDNVPSSYNYTTLSVAAHGQHNTFASQDTAQPEYIPSSTPKSSNPEPSSLLTLECSQRSGTSLFQRDATTSGEISATHPAQFQTITDHDIHAHGKRTPLRTTATNDSACSTTTTRINETLTRQHEPGQKQRQRHQEEPQQIQQHISPLQHQQDYYQLQSEQRQSFQFQGTPTRTTRTNDHPACTATTTRINETLTTQHEVGQQQRQRHQQEPQQEQRHNLPPLHQPNDYQSQSQQRQPFQFQDRADCYQQPPHEDPWGYPYQPQWQHPPQPWPQFNQAFKFASEESVVAVRKDIASLEKKLMKKMRDLNILYERELSTEFPEKPRLLPLTSPDQINDFEAIPNDEYRDVVRYLGSLGGHTLVETANEILKNAMKDSVSPALTWHGLKANEIALGKTKFAKALYAAVARNRNYPKPDWSQFTDAMTNALRSSKQRHRNSLKPRENHRGVGGNVRPHDQPRRTENRPRSHSQTHDEGRDSDTEISEGDTGRQNRIPQHRTRNNAAHQRPRQRRVSSSSSVSLTSSVRSRSPNQ